MGTVTYKTVTGFLIVDRWGAMKVRRRCPQLAELAHDEYVFMIDVRIPSVRRERVAGNVTIELPVPIDPDVQPMVDVTGPLAGPETIPAVTSAIREAMAGPEPDEGEPGG
jgi:hypothetical protein